MLSIITVTYNDPVGLKNTISSLKFLKQDFEHIIVDSSPKLTLPILKSFKGTNFIHVNQKASGIYSAMNEGIKTAKGETLWFLNGGDELFDIHTLEKILENFKNSDWDLVCAGANLYRNNKFQYPSIPNPIFYKNLLGKNKICHQAVIYRRSSFDRLGPFQEKYTLAADYDHHFKAMVNRYKIKVLADVLVKYDFSGTSTNWVLAIKEFDRIRRSYQKNLPEWQVLLFKVRSKWEANWLRLVKGLSQSRVSYLLRPVWIWWHRHRH